MKELIIAVDIDGTLLNDSSQLSVQNLQAIERLSKKGILVVPSTGRTYYEIPQELRDCEALKYFIFSNGSGIYERGKGVIYSSTVPQKDATEIFSLLNSYDTYIEIYSGGYPYADCSKMNEASFDHYRIPVKFRKTIRRSRKSVEGFYSAVQNGKLCAELFDAFFSNEAERAECLMQIKRQFPLIEVVSSIGNNLEIMNKGTNKGTALLKLCEILCVDKSRTAAIGDSENDLALFGNAGSCYAVSNAREALKARATAVICSNNEHVIEYAEKNFL